MMKKASFAAIQAALVVALLLCVCGSQAQVQSGAVGTTTPPADMSGTPSGMGGVWRIPVSELENALAQLNAESSSPEAATATTDDLEEALSSISGASANPDGPIASTLSSEFPAFDSESAETVSDDDDGNFSTDDDDEFLAFPEEDEIETAPTEPVTASSSTGTGTGTGAVSTTVTDPVTTGINWNQAYTMDFTSVMAEESNVLQAFGPGLVPLPENDMRMKDLRANFNFQTNLTYPLRVTSGYLMNGTKAGTINIGLKDLVTKLKEMPGSSNEFQALVRDNNLPILISVDELVNVPIDEFPEYMSYQVVCTDWQNTYLNLLDPVKQECLNKPTEIKVNLIPEFAFLQRLICMEVPPAVAWAEQCQGWSSGFLSTGSDCVWESPRNVTIADTETDLAKIVDSRLEVSMLNAPLTDTVHQHEIPIQMTVQLEMVEEFLNIVSNQGFPTGGISPNFPGVNQFFNQGRKLLQGPQDMVGVIMDRRIETSLIPQKPVQQLTRAEGQALVSIC